MPFGKQITIRPEEVANFNASWPCSELRSRRHYRFEFDARGDLVDCDVPESDDGSAASAMADDCKSYLFGGVVAPWMDCGR